MKVFESYLSDEARKAEAKVYGRHRRRLDAGILVRFILQGIPALSFFALAALADSLMDTYGPRKFMIVALVWMAVCAVMIGVSRLLDGRLDRKRWRK